MIPRSTIVAVVVAVALAGSGAGLRADSPAAGMDGLVAWYDLAPLHEHTQDGAPLAKLDDATGHGHDLVADGVAPPATFRVQAVNGKPAVVLPRYESYSVVEPFSLDDFTLAIVYRPNCRDCGLFRSERPGEDGRGVVLRSGGRQDVVRLGPRSVPFGGTLDLPPDRFVVALLGRRDGALRAEIDGRDASTGASHAPSLRVGTFFNVSRSRAVKDDGAGLEIAELLVFSRWLSRDERRTLTAYLGERYGIEVAEPAEDPDPVPPAPTREESAAWLSLRSPQSLPPDVPATVAWNVIDKQSVLVRPHQSSPGRIGCSTDGTKVGLHAELAVAEPPGVTVRALVLVNGATYLPEQATAVNGRLVLRAELSLDAGDVVEVVAIAEVVGDDPSAATVESEGSFLAVTAK